MTANILKVAEASTKSSTFAVNGRIRAADIRFRGPLYAKRIFRRVASLTARRFPLIKVKLFRREEQ